MIYRLLKESSIVPQIPVYKDNNNESVSLFTMAIDCISESDDYLRSELVNYHLSSLNEGTIDNIIRKFDLAKIIKKIIDLFNKAIQKIFAAFKAVLTRLNYMDRTIKKYEKELKSWDGEMILEGVYHNYTHLATDIPSSDLYMHFNEVFEDSVEELKKIPKKANKEDILFVINKCAEESAATQEEFLGKIRNSIISSGNMMIDEKFTSKENYPVRLFSLFRSGAVNSSERKLVIVNKDVREMTDRFINAKELVKKVESTKSTTEAESKKVEKKMKNLTADSLYPDFKDDYEINAALEKFGRHKAGLLHEMCNIYVLAFSAKTEAIKEAVIQDKKILYKVITEIIMKGGNK